MLRYILLFMGYFFYSQLLLAQQPTMNQPSLGFEPNKGQIVNDQHQTQVPIKYQLKGEGMTMFLAANQFYYQWTKQTTPLAIGKASERTTSTVQVQLIGANPNPVIEQQQKSKDYSNYYDKAAYQVYRYQRLTYKEIYPHIDWVIYTTPQGIKYDFVVRPQGDPHQIKMLFRQHQCITINGDGSLTLQSELGELTEQAPVSLQQQQEIATAFVLHNDTLSFALATYDTEQTLVIDPNVFWATYYGGNQAEHIRNIVLDQQENIYAAGYTSSTNQISTNQTTLDSGKMAAFLVKFDSSGNRLWSTYYGSGNSRGVDCAVDAAQNVYLVGYTSNDTGIAFGGHQNTLGGLPTLFPQSDAFVVKFDSHGNRIWATYYGGSKEEEPRACAIDQTGSLYIVGVTGSSDLTYSGSFQDTLVYSRYSYSRDGFIVKLDSNGTVEWGSYCGGISLDELTDCAIDTNNHCYVVGWASDSIINMAGRPTSGNSGFAIKFDAMGNHLWSDYYGGGGTPNERCYATTCAVDRNNQFYMAGYTNIENGIATANSHQVNRFGSYDGFVAKFDDQGNRIWGTYYGGEREDRIQDCQVDDNGDVYLGGYTFSNQGIASVPTIPTYSRQGFLARLDVQGNRVWGFYYGGKYATGTVHTCAIAANNHLYGAGETQQSRELSTVGSHQSTYGRGPNDGWLSKLNKNYCPISYSTDTIDATTVSNYTWIDGINYTHNNYTATYTYKNRSALGCDSVVQLHLTLCGNGSLPTASSWQSDTICDSYTWAENGETYYRSEIRLPNSTYSPAYTILPNAAANGCDSVIFLDVIIYGASRPISQYYGTLVYNDPYGQSYRSIYTYSIESADYTYQWVDCNNNNTPIAGATKTTFTPQDTGCYALQITTPLCVRTSRPFHYTINSNSLLDNAPMVAVYPNPSTGKFVLKFHLISNPTVRIFATNGQLVYQANDITDKVHFMDIDLPNGIYILHAANDKKSTQQKLIIGN